MIAETSVVRHRATRNLLHAGIVLAAVATGVAFSTKDAHAEDVAGFYKGKQMKFIIRSAGGGGYDLYSRLIASHIVRHIPGSPSMLPVNMPGGGGIIAANYMADVAPKDGTHLTMISESLPMDQALGLTPSFKADLRTFGWVGNLSASNLLLYTWHTSPIKTMEDAKKREATMGATGAGSAPSWLPALCNNVLGTKFKIIQGYKSGAEVKLAMERGEVEGYGANPWASLMSANPDLVQDKKLSILMQVGVKKEKELSHVPLLSELTDDPEGKAILEFVSKSMAAGRPIGTTPGVPADRLAALRKAFDDTLLDPVFIADAKKMGAEIEPINGATLQDLIGEVIGAPQEIKNKAKAVLPERS